MPDGTRRGAESAGALVQDGLSVTGNAGYEGGVRLWRAAGRVNGSIDNVPDSTLNSAYFGCASAQRGDSAFPQVQRVYLCEWGTHAIYDAAFWPYAVSERRGGKRLLRSVQADMLVMWDRGFHECDLLSSVRSRGAQPAHMKPERVDVLPDGTGLASLHPSDPKRQTQERLLMWVIEYTLDDPPRDMVMTSRIVV